MKKIFFSTITFFVLSNFSFAQKQEHYIVMSYNVENLFDTIDNPKKNDEAFLPASKNKWNTKAYNNKSRNIAKVISSIDSCGCPAIVGLCEVENKKVVEDLINNVSLKKCKYKFVHFESSDPRGIDDALLYNPDFFKLITEKNFISNTPIKGKPYHHDFLYTKGILGKDTLNIFLNHFKSRSPNKDSTEFKRILESSFLKNKIDSLFTKNKNSKIIIMGDFNDTPIDKSILKTLDAKVSLQNIPPFLYNPYIMLAEEGKGSYFYKGEWFFFDQIIVSNALLEAKKGIKFDSKKTYVYKPEWLFFEKKGEKIPSMYFSDHLPVYIILERK